MKKILILIILISNFNLSFGASHPIAAEATNDEKRKAVIEHKEAQADEHSKTEIPKSFAKAGLSLEDLVFLNSQEPGNYDSPRFILTEPKLIIALDNIILTGNHNEFENILKFLKTNPTFKKLYDTFFIRLIMALSNKSLLNDEFLKLFVRYHLIDEIIKALEPRLRFPQKELTENYNKIKDFKKKQYEEYLKYKKDHETKFSEELKKHLVPGLPELTSSFHELTFDEYLDLKNKK